jgi:hypothetical protein
MTMDREARNALIRAHQNNINRYCRLLATNLTDVEREYVHRRIVEERQHLERLLTPPKASMRSVAWKLHPHPDASSASV